MDDSEIIALLFDRNEQGLQRVQDRYGAYCLVITKRILPTHEDAEECVSDALTQIWQTIPPKRPDSIKYYFVTIARNLAINRLHYERRKKRGGGQSMEILDELSDCAAKTGNPEQELEARLLQEYINLFLSNLTERERDLFLKRYYFSEELTDIADFYGLSKSSVSVILFRVRRKLEKYLKKEGLL